MAYRNLGLERSIKNWHQKMSEKVAIFILKNNIETVFFDACPNQFRDKAGSVYEKYSSQEDNGFYDWLRAESGMPIGVTWFPHSSKFLNSKRIKYLKLQKYIDIPDALEMTIWFAESQRKVDMKNSCDQDFGGNNIYFSESGVCAISFSISNLSENAIGALPI
jgi:hypothetical protein